MLNSPQYGEYLQSMENIASIFSEQKRLETRINIVYVLTFLGALLVMSGPLPKDTKFGAFGVEAPLAVLPQQAIAVLTAGVFGYYCTQFLSLMITSQMILRIFRKQRAESWQFLAARFDVGGIWSVLITPKFIGYASPKREFIFSLAVILMALSVVAAHAMIVNFAMVIAFRGALHTPSRLLIFFGGASLVITAVSTLAVLVALLLPMPYRLKLQAQTES